MTRFLLLAVSAAVLGTLAGIQPASAEEYAYCSSEGVGAGQSCTYETMAQCQSAASAAGIYCYRNPRYTAPAVATPAPQPAPVAPPAPPKRQTKQPSGTKS